MTWDEIDLEAATCAVPAERMKAHREHRDPLSDRALEVLAERRRAVPRRLWLGLPQHAGRSADQREEAHEDAAEA